MPRAISKSKARIFLDLTQITVFLSFREPSRLRVFAVNGALEPNRKDGKDHDVRLAL